MAEPASVTKRKAWRFEDHAGQHGILDLLRDAGELGVFYTFKLLPACFVSWLGGRIGRAVISRWPGAINRLSHNLKLIHPDASDEQIKSWIGTFAESQGRQRAEYCILPRMACKSRNLTFIGTGDLAERFEGRPVIFIGLHISNWEMSLTMLKSIGLPVAGSYQPPGRRLHHWLINRTRQKIGFTILPPGKDAVRPALKLLSENGRLIVFCDEGFNGVLRGPLFGRPPHLQGNLAFVARMARRTNAVICPVFVTRTEGIRFTLHALAPFDLPQTDDGSITDDVVFLNSIIEPIIARHAAEWFFLSNKIQPL